MNRHASSDSPRNPPAETLESERHQEIARCLFRESNDALFLFDPDDHRVIDANPVALRLSGFPKGRLLAMKLWDLFAGESPDHLARVIEAYRETGFYHSHEGFSLARSKGEPIPVNLSVSRIHVQPDPLGLVVARDITSRKRAEEALRASEARYRRLVESAQVIFWSLGPDGRIVALNPQFAAVTGRPVEECLGRPLVDLLAPGDRERARARLIEADPGRLPPAIDLRVDAACGRDCILEFLPTACEAGPGGVALSGIARDVTEAHRAAQAIREAEAQERARRAAEEADRAKSVFLAHFSHEIRTPLTAILGFTDVLLADESVAALPAERIEDLRIIERSGAHLLAIINDILDLSEVEAGKLRIRPEPCEPARIADEVADALAVRAGARGLDLAVRVQSNAPEAILTDPVRFRQILINLAGNAIKFTERGGVTIRVASREGRELIVEVIDTGPGITPEALARLFEPFYRAGAKAGTGSGLGLAISRRLAEALGGRIEVESEPGRGSTFRLVLPIAAASEASAPGEAPSLPVAAELPSIRARVLLAEDNPSIQRVTALHLEKVGAEVTLARNGQEALDLALAASSQGCPFDAVLMDMQMPVLDGYEATRLLRSHGFAGTIIALTAYAMAEDRDECLRIGCDDHLSKPVDWARLNALLAEHLRAKAKG